MTLTHEDMAFLKKPFEPNQHDFLRGYTYVKEYAVTDRLEQIDPAWSFEIVKSVIDPERQQFHVYARMTIKGSVRDGIGTADLQWMAKTKWVDRKKIPVLDENGNPVMIAANEAEKSAATDALKRCARMFGVGRYLTEIKSDDKISNEQQLGAWLQRNFPTGETPQQTPTKQRTNPQNQPKQKQVLLQDVRRKESKDGKKKWLSFTTAGGLECSAWARTPFIEAGYVTDTDWPKDKIDVVWEVDPQIPCFVNLNDKGYYIIDVDSIPPFNPDWEALHAGTPATDDKFGDVPL